jgi:hypothetical protein
MTRSFSLETERPPFFGRTTGDAMRQAQPRLAYRAAWKQRDLSMLIDASPPSTPRARLFTLFRKVNAHFSFSKQRAESLEKMSDHPEKLSSPDEKMD